MYKRETKLIRPDTDPAVLGPGWYFKQHLPYGSEYAQLWEKALDPRIANPTSTTIIPEVGYMLMPGEVYLYACNEKLGVKGNIRARCEGKSSLGRLGLFVHVTAGFIDPGFEGSLVLELVATRPIIVYPNMKICQIEYSRVEGEILEPYDKKKGSKYAGQTGVQESLYHKNYDEADEGERKLNQKELLS